MNSAIYMQEKTSMRKGKIWISQVEIVKEDKIKIDTLRNVLSFLFFLIWSDVFIQKIESYWKQNSLQDKSPIFKKKKSIKMAAAPLGHFE